MAAAIQVARPAVLAGGGVRLRAAAGLIALALAWLLAAAALAAPTFPQLTGRVVDGARLLTPQTQQKLTDDLARLEAQTGHQLVVATVPDLQGYPIEDFGYQLGRTWALGRKGQNDGAILLVAPNDRKVRIEVGYGLEPVLTDALSNVILQQKVLPRFREGRMEQGVVDGTEAIIQQLSLPQDQAKANVAQAQQAEQARQARGGGNPIGLIITVLVLFWVFGAILRGFGGRRGGGGGAWWLLPLLLSSGRGGGWGGGGRGGGGGFSGGGGSFGGGGSSGSW